MISNVDVFGSRAGFSIMAKKIAPILLQFTCMGLFISIPKKDKMVLMNIISVHTSDIATYSASLEDYVTFLCLGLPSHQTSLEIDTVSRYTTSVVFVACPVAVAESLQFPIAILFL